jgi:hypothetical protein
MLNGILLRIYEVYFTQNAVFCDVTPCGCCNIPEDGILHTYRRKTLKSCIALAGWTL